MPQVISLRDVLHKRSEVRSCQPASIDRSVSAQSSPASPPPLINGDIDRAVLLLDAAAEQARLLITQSNDPSCAQVEARTASIVQLLGLARIVTPQLG
ncbi:MAG: hypothetical protein ABW175_25740 [Bradyrhizobium sp.]